MTEKRLFKWFILVYTFFMDTKEIREYKLGKLEGLND